jgi:hypothetical protein
LAKLTDLQKKKIIADYIETQNYCETARRNNVSDVTVRDVVSKDKTTLEKLEQKKEENTRDILEYMDKIYDKQKSIIDLSLSALEEKLKSPDMFMNVKDIATVYGVIFDKALKYKEMKQKNNIVDSNVTKIQIINDLPKDGENE